MNEILQKAISKSIVIDTELIKKYNKYSNNGLDLMLKKINDKILVNECEIYTLVEMSKVINMLLLDEKRKRTKWWKFWYGK